MKHNIHKLICRIKGHRGTEFELKGTPYTWYVCDRCEEHYFYET